MSDNPTSAGPAAPLPLLVEDVQIFQIVESVCQNDEVVNVWDAHIIVKMVRDEYEADRKQAAATIEALQQQLESERNAHRLASAGLTGALNLAEDEVKQLRAQLAEAKIDGQYWHDKYLTGGDGDGDAQLGQQSPGVPLPAWQPLPSGIYKDITAERASIEIRADMLIVGNRNGIVTTVLKDHVRLCRRATREGGGDNGPTATADCRLLTADPEILLLQSAVVVGSAVAVGVRRSEVDFDCQLTFHRGSLRLQFLPATEPPYL